MVGKAHRGTFTPKHPEKYIGGNVNNIQFRSSWEFAFMSWVDNVDSILAWSSESISIPYRNPLTGKQTVYIPDFLIVYQNKQGKKLAEMIEIKPAKEVPGMLKEQKISKRDKLAQIINAAKWQAALIFCSKRNIRFRVVTEHDLFMFKRK